MHPAVEHLSERLHEVQCGGAELDCDRREYEPNEYWEGVCLWLSRGFIGDRGMNLAEDGPWYDDTDIEGGIRRMFYDVLDACRSTLNAEPGHLPMIYVEAHHDDGTHALVTYKGRVIYYQERSAWNWWYDTLAELEAELKEISDMLQTAYDAAKDGAQFLTIHVQGGMLATVELHKDLAEATARVQEVSEGKALDGTGEEAMAGTFLNDMYAIEAFADVEAYWHGMWVF